MKDINRLYYAASHAAQAALYDRNVDPGSHGAVRNRFGEELGGLSPGNTAAS